MPFVPDRAAPPDMCVDGLDDAGRLDFGDQDIDKHADFAVRTNGSALTLPFIFYDFLLYKIFLISCGSRLPDSCSSLVGDS